MHVYTCYLRFFFWPKHKVSQPWHYWYFGPNYSVLWGAVLRIVECIAMCQGSSEPIEYIHIYTHTEQEESGEIIFKALVHMIVVPGKSEIYRAGWQPGNSGKSWSELKPKLNLKSKIHSSLRLETQAHFRGNLSYSIEAEFLLREICFCSSGLQLIGWVSLVLLWVISLKSTDCKC